MCGNEQNDASTLAKNTGKLERSEIFQHAVDSIMFEVHPSAAMKAPSRSTESRSAPTASPTKYPITTPGHPVLDPVTGTQRMKNIYPDRVVRNFSDDLINAGGFCGCSSFSYVLLPMGGCFPIMVQIPVFIALYWVLLSSVEMRNAPWLGWIHDLSAPDPFYVLAVADDA
jgi:hypothetical protein